MSARAVDTLRLTWGHAFSELTHMTVLSKDINCLQRGPLCRAAHNKAAGAQSKGKESESAHTGKMEV